jgi:integrase/recombinase XerD
VTNNRATATSICVRPERVSATSAVGAQPHNADYGHLVLLRETADRAVTVAHEFVAAYSGHTAAAYRSDLQDFFRHCHQHATPPLSATRADLAAYLHRLQAAGCAPATVARRLVSLRGFFGLAVAEYGLTTSPAQRIRMRRGRSQTRIHALTSHELRAFLTSADGADRRTAGLAWLLATTGLRISEACAARIEDVSFHTGEGWLDVTCKGGLRRSVPVHADDWVRLSPLTCWGRGPLFATRTGRPLDRHAASRTLIKVAAQAGIDTGFSPHVLRHTFVTLARQAGCSLEDVQDAAGHADPATTRRYDRTLQRHSDHPAHKMLAGLTAGGRNSGLTGSCHEAPLRAAPSTRAWPSSC